MALIDAALAAAKEIGIPAAVAVVDATGYLRAFERTDDAPFLTADVAIDKAWSSASFGFPTHVWNDYVSNDPKVAPLAYRPRMVAVGGGYPILEDGKLIGGIGIWGGNGLSAGSGCVRRGTQENRVPATSLTTVGHRGGDGRQIRPCEISYDVNVCRLHAGRHHRSGCTRNLFSTPGCAAGAAIRI